MADREQEDEAVLVQVCLKCGKEYMFDEGQQPPADLRCEKCGSDVFRSFHADTEDEAETDFRESTERDTLTTDPATDVTRGDLQDLGNM